VRRGGRGGGAFSLPHCLMSHGLLSCRRASTQAPLPIDYHCSAPRLSHLYWQMEQVLGIGSIPVMTQEVWNASATHPTHRLPSGLRLPQRIPLLKARLDHPKLQQPPHHPPDGLSETKLLSGD
jgi:hypothetical protein